MTKQQNDVRTFMQTFGQATPNSPTVPDRQTRNLRIKLLLEEVLELAEASGVTIVDTRSGQLLKGDALAMAAEGEVDLVGVADALADIDYVNQGAAVAYGLDLEPFQDEVHSSNMTKLWSEAEVASPAMKVGYSIEGSNSGGYVVRNENGKVMKSPSYRPANLAPILEHQQD